MIIRNARKEDLAAIAALAKAMVAYHHRLDGYYRSSADYENLAAELEDELGDKNGLMLVTEEDGKVVGYFRGAIESAPAYTSAKKIGAVYDLVVAPEHRRRKIGEKIFQAALEWFRARKIGYIELSVDARNLAGLAFWKNQGFFEYKIRMRLDMLKSD